MQGARCSCKVCFCEISFAVLCSTWVCFWLTVVCCWSRVRLSGMKIVRPPVAIGHYKMIKHKGDRGNEQNPRRYVLAHSQACKDFSFFIWSNVISASVKGKIFKRPDHVTNFSCLQLFSCWVFTIIVVAFCLLTQWFAEFVLCLLSLRARIFRLIVSKT